MYSAQWSPHAANIAASASGDCSVKILDCKGRVAAPWPETRCERAMCLFAVGRSVLALAAHSTEALTVDWNKYNSNMIATAGLDRVIKLWVSTTCGWSLTCVTSRVDPLRTSGVRNIMSCRWLVISWAYGG